MVNKTVNNKYIKKLNRIAILNVVKENQPIGRQALAQATGLTPPAITGIVRRSVTLGARWDNFPIRKALEDELSLPVFTENNSNAGILMGGRLLQGF